MSERVYIVTQSYYGMGVSIFGVFSTEAFALDYADARSDADELGIEEWEIDNAE